MKVLIVSHNPITDYNSMGKTMLSLFSQFQEEELVQLYIYPTIPNIRKCQSYYRITDNEVITSIFTFKKPGRILEKEEIQEQNRLFEKDSDRLLFANRDRFQTFQLIFRGIVWKLGHWKTKDLQAWIKEEKPDCIFAAPGLSSFFYDMVFYISHIGKLPIICYFCDDFYQYDRTKISFLTKLYRNQLRSKIKMLVMKSKAVLTICDELKEAYDKEFGCSAITVTTGTNYTISATTAPETENVMAYFGSLELGRNLSLARIGEALDRINASDGKAYQLRIYSNVFNPNKIKVFESIRSIQVMPFLQGDKVLASMKECSVLVHAESFDLKYRDRIRYSLSTKIADSLASGVCMFAYGPKESASVNYLIKHQCAKVVTVEKDLEPTLRILMNSSDLRSYLAGVGLTVAHQNHDSMKQGQLVRTILQDFFHMKIMQVNCVYKKGSTGRLMEEISVNLKKNGYESIICYGRGQKCREDNVYKTASEFFSKIRKVISIFSGMHYNKCLFPTLKLIHIIKKERPDIVHLHCINGYFVNICRVINYLKKNCIPTVLTLHAEFMYTANCPHANDCIQWLDGCQKCAGPYPAAAKSFSKMKKAFDQFDALQVVSVSSWLMNRAKASLILRKCNHIMIENGVHTEIFHYRTCNEASDDIRKLFTRKTVLHVTANFLDENKGGNYVLQMANLLPQIRFIIIGYNGNKLLPPNVTGIRYLENQSELSLFYSLADITLLTSKRETFGMVAAESLCCGTPVVGFLAGGPETVAINEYSAFSEYGDIMTLMENIQYWLENDYDKNEISRLAVKKYDSKLMYEQYLRLYKGILKNGNSK